jgi:hypothetical protein
MIKKALNLICLIIPLIVLSQGLQDNSPWMQNNSLKSKSKLTLEDISQQAELFFSSFDRFQKGSGLKPFKRWEYHWSFYTQNDGTISPASALWNSWRQKNTLNNSKQNNLNDTSNWTSLGPYSHTNTASWSSGQGRVNVVTVDPNNPNTYYVGAPAGGIWKSTDAGVNWQPLTDYLPQIGVSGIAIDPNNSNIIYIATGDDDANDSYSVGVMKSTDGGSTWNNAGNISATSMNDIYVDPNNSNTLWVATNQGVYKSTNAGTSWVLKLSGNIRDLKMKPGDTSTWYAATSNTVYKSFNAGESFNAVSIPGFTNSTRIALAVTEADPNYVYFISAGNVTVGGQTKSNYFNGLYKSVNSGSSFTKSTETQDIFRSTQAWYDLAITASDTQANTIYVGVLNIWKSTNGGNNFSQMNSWNLPNSDPYTHADIHFMTFINGKFFAGTDGGVYVSTNHGAKFTDLTENLAISQFYKISVAQQNSGNIVGGLQDNGGYAFKNNNWNNYFGADGMDCTVNPLDENNYFGFTQYGGSMYETTDGGLTRKGSVGAPSAETGSGDSGGRWVTPMVSNSKGEIFAGYSQLYKLENGNWNKISNHNFGGDLYNVVIDPNDDNIIFTTRLNSLYKSTDGGVTFNKIITSVGSINSFEINSNNSNEAWYVTSAGVFKTSNLHDANPTITNITKNLPFESKLVIKHHQGHKENRVYLGTSLGVYFIDDSLTSWQTFDNNLPNVAVRDIEINVKEAKLTAATYGRGIFVTNISKSLVNDDVKLSAINSPINNSTNCGAISPKVTIVNQGANTINSINFKYNIDGNTNSVYNWTGTLNSQESITIDIPTIVANKGDHTLNIEAELNNDSFSSNNKKSVAFKINELNATPTTINTFESSNDDLIVITSGGNGSDLWQRGAPTKTKLNTLGSGTNAYATSLSGNYTNLTTSILLTKCYDLTQITNPIFNFKMAFDIERDWDYLVVEYSTNDGNNWNILGSASDPNWYTSSSVLNGLPGKQWSGWAEDINPVSGTNATLNSYSYNLAALSSESKIVFRFKFVSDQLENGEGVVLDDLVITGTLPVEEFNEIKGLSIYPNPSNGNFSINWNQGSDFTISVFDLTGKLLLQEKRDTNSMKQFDLDLSKFGKGIYFAKIKVDDKLSTRKLILK